MNSSAFGAGMVSVDKLVEIARIGSSWLLGSQTFNRPGSATQMIAKHSLPH